MMDDPAFVTVNDAGGTAMTFTEAGLKKIRENAYWIRPRISGAGATTDLDVYMLVYAER